MAEAAVVVTRPAGQADVLINQLRAIGRVPVQFPLLEIHPLADPAPLRSVLARLHEFALVAFVSPNAIDATFAHIEKWPVTTPLAVMGDGSRRALALHGVDSQHYRITSPTDLSRSDSQTLLAALDLAALDGERVLILRGESGRELLADALRSAGIAVEQVAAYRRAEPAMTPARCAHLQALLDGENNWIITSSEAVRILMRQVQHVDPHNGVAKMQRQKIFVSHHRIAETAQTLGLRAVFLTAAGDTGMLTALQSRP